VTYPTGELPNELDILRDVSERLERAGIAFMLTGSLAMNYYAEPRMTRDIDMVIEIRPDDTERVAALFEPEYYVSRDAVVEAVANRTSFNLIHRDSVIKVDCFPRKPGAFRQIEFDRRQQARIGELVTYLVTREDLILSKLLWASESLSEVQLRDVRNLMASPFDQTYVSEWVDRLGLTTIWKQVRP
jgi:hypothetical protein